MPVLKPRRPTKLGRALFDMMYELKKARRAMQIKNNVKELYIMDDCCPCCGFDNFLGVYNG